MRIVILTQYYKPEIGAPQVRLRALATTLKARGHEIEVVTAMPNHGTGRILDGYRRKLYLREDIDGVPVHRTWIYAAVGTGVKRLANYFSFLFTCAFGLARCKRPDLIFVESPPLFLSFPGWLAALWFRSKLVFNVADLWPDSVRDLHVIESGALLMAAEQLERWSYRRADIVNAVTRGIAVTLAEKKNVPQGKIRFFPNGVDTEMWRPLPPDTALRAALGLGDLPVFVYAGTHGIAQGLEHLVDAAALTRGKAELVFIGAGSTKRQIQRYAQLRNIANVHFLDPVSPDEMSAYFSLATAAIVPLVRSNVTADARPSKIFSAFACGVPVIYCGEGEGARLVREAQAGLVVEPEDPRALAACMLELIEHPEQRAEMAERARKTAVDDYAWPIIVERWLDSLRKEATPA